MMMSGERTVKYPRFKATHEAFARPGFSPEHSGTKPKRCACRLLVVSSSSTRSVDFAMLSYSVSYLALDSTEHSNGGPEVLQLWTSSYKNTRFCLVAHMSTICSLALGFSVLWICLTGPLSSLTPCESYRITDTPYRLSENGGPWFAYRHE